MFKVMEPPPYSQIEPITEILHGVPVTDSYRWLEDQDSPRTRGWLRAQTRYARSYLDSIPGREFIRERVRDLLDVETHDSFQMAGNRYIFPKRLPGQEQPCIYLRAKTDGPDQLLVDPAQRATGPHTAVKPVRVSRDGRLLLYEVKQGGERTGTFELMDLNTRSMLPDALPRGYLRSFAFAPDSQSFFYVHEAIEPSRRSSRAAYHHILGASFDDDQEVFLSRYEGTQRLGIILGREHLGFLLVRVLDKTYTDFYLWPLLGKDAADAVIRNAGYRFGPVLLNDGRILAITNREAPNFRIVEVRHKRGKEAEFVTLIPASGSMIQGWTVAGDRIFVSYIRGLKTEIECFDFSGRRLGKLATQEWETIRLAGGTEDSGELFIERESFTRPVQIHIYSTKSSASRLLTERKIPFDWRQFAQTRVWFSAKDGVRIPMFLTGRRDVLAGGLHPVVMTSYGGYGLSMTPQFSVLVAFLIEQGCLFALPNIRGGSEFGVEWHNAAKRRNRHVAFDDFLAAAEWLIEAGRAEPPKLAVFGGSNSGLLVGAAMTERPDLFCAVLCMVPILDMLRYHLFDRAHIWKEEFGTADDAEDFAALFANSPYHRVRDGMEYPATMIVSGDSDQNCNPLHARKMVARLQSATVSDRPVFLDYSRHRGHSPVLPLSDRVESLTDRLAFLCDRLGLSV